MHKGFTLVEAMIVVALVAVLSIVLGEFYIGQTQGYRRQMSDLDLNYSGRMALDDIDGYVRQAAQTLSSYSTYTAGPTVLILEIQGVNSSNQLIPGVYDHVIIYKNGSEVLRLVEPDPTSSRAAQTKQIASNVSALTFTYNNADFAQVTEIATDLVLLENLGRETRNLTISSKSNLRN